jgi:hypothetical protein
MTAQTSKKTEEKTNIFYEIIGWYGTAAIMGAYASNSFGMLDATNIWYQILNGTGAVGIVLISIKKKAYQPATLNAIWTVIAIIGLIQILTRPVS